VYFLRLIFDFRYREAYLRECWPQLTKALKVPCCHCIVTACIYLFE
jgi:hypothetical protein